MGDKIIICGGNGAGKSTLGRALARATGYRFADIEDYYFPDRDRDYVYGTSRSRAEVQALLLKDMFGCKLYLGCSQDGLFEIPIAKK